MNTDYFPFPVYVSNCTLAKCPHLNLELQQDRTEYSSSEAPTRIISPNANHLRANHKLKPVVKGIFQMIFKHWQAWSINYLSREPVPVWTPSHKEMLPNVKSKSPLITVTFTPQQLIALLLVILSPGKMITLTWSEFLLHSGFPGPWFQCWSLSCSWDLPFADCCAFSIHFTRRDKNEKASFAFEL